MTEDADLGVRLARRRMRVDVLASCTREAAPTRLWPWLGQRTRWMKKGWMQTFIVHNRDPGRLLGEMGLAAFLGFQTLVLGMIVAPILHCVFLGSLWVRLWLGADLADGSMWTLFYLAMLVLGYGSAMAMTLLGLLRLRASHLLASQAWLPAYWLLVGLATIRAALELVHRPFYWFKSPHDPAVQLTVGWSPAGRLGHLAVCVAHNLTRLIILYSRQHDAAAGPAAPATVPGERR